MVTPKMSSLTTDAVATASAAHNTNNFMMMSFRMRLTIVAQLAPFICELCFFFFHYHLSKTLSSSDLRITSFIIMYHDFVGVGRALRANK